MTNGQTDKQTDGLTELFLKLLSQLKTETRQGQHMEKSGTILNLSCKRPHHTLHTLYSLPSHTLIPINSPLDLKQLFLLTHFELDTSEPLSSLVVFLVHWKENHMMIN